MASSGTIIEEGKITLSGASAGSHNFSASFTENPTIVLSVNNSVSGPGPDFAVTAVVTSVTTTSFSIITSAAITGEVNFRAVGS